MKRWIYNLLILICAGVFLTSAGLLGKYIWDSKTQARQYEALAQMVEQVQPQRPTIPPETTSPPETAPSADPTAPTETQPEETVPDNRIEITDPNTGVVRMVLPEYAELYRSNPHMAGWISIPGTRINYPVMHYPEERDYYLYLDFYGRYSKHGSLYVREVCDVFTPSDNVTIYGHRMRDGSMFYDLTAYKDSAFFQENRYIYFDTVSEYHTYEIMAVFLTTAVKNKGFAYHLFETAPNDEAYYQFVNTCKELSLYETGVTAQPGDKLITLSTCDYTFSNGRLVVVAKRIM